LVTTEPNELVAQIHDRLALILHPRDYDRWLGIDDKGGDPRPRLDLLHPYDADRMVMKPANPANGMLPPSAITKGCASLIHAGGVRFG
jgi:putative SOS response-associated peptidase YedK